MAEYQIPPVHTLPRDVLIEIFSLVQSGPISFGDPSVPAWQISLVCTSWLEVAFNMPQLWTNIRLEPRRLPKDDEAFDVMLTSWKSLLNRSRGYSLNLILHDGLYLPLLLAECFEHADRWDRVEFGFPLDELLPFMSNPDIVFPRLRSVSLTGTGRPEAPEMLQRLTLFKNAPFLSDISFLDLAISIQDLKLPWSQITHCRIKRPVETRDSLEEFAVIPRLMPNIVSLGIFRYQEGSDHDGLRVATVLPYLRKLTLGTEHAPLFLNSIRAPCLNDLEILGPTETALWRPSVSDFLLQSGCHITSITFGPFVYFKSSFLASLPHLESLSVLPVHSNKEFLRDLTIKKSQSQYLCPKLRKLTLSNIYMTEVWLQDLASMLESRLRFSGDSKGDHRQKLESLHIITWPHAEDGAYDSLIRQDVARLQRLKEYFSRRYTIQITQEGRHLDSFWNLSPCFRQT